MGKGIDLDHRERKKYGEGEKQVRKLLRRCATTMTKSAKAGWTVVSSSRGRKIKHLIETVRKGCEQRQKLRIESEGNTDSTLRMNQTDRPMTD